MPGLTCGDMKKSKGGPAAFRRASRPLPHSIIPNGSLFHVTRQTQADSRVGGQSVPIVRDDEA
jgi:hypothetical protein